MDGVFGGWERGLELDGLKDWQPGFIWVYFLGKSEWGWKGWEGEGRKKKRRGSATVSED